MTTSQLERFREKQLAFEESALARLRERPIELANQQREKAERLAEAKKPLDPEAERMATRLAELVARLSKQEKERTAKRVDTKGRK